MKSTVSADDPCGDPRVWKALAVFVRKHRVASDSNDGVEWGWFREPPGCGRRLVGGPPSPRHRGRRTSAVPLPVQLPRHGVAFAVLGTGNALLRDGCESS